MLNSFGEGEMTRNVILEEKCMFALHFNRMSPLGGLVVRGSDYGARGRGLILTRVTGCILEKDTFTSQISTGNTQEVVAPSRHD